MELSIKTTQHIPMFSIFSLDGQLYQKIGFCSDYEVCEAIDQDDSITDLFDFDFDAVQEILTDSNY